MTRGDPEWRGPALRTRRIAMALLAAWCSLEPVRAAEAASDTMRCATVAQVLDETSVLPDGSREARSTLGAMSITARDRHPGILCAQECALTLRFADGRVEAYRLAGAKVAIGPWQRKFNRGAPNVHRALYFRMRPLEWIAVTVVSRRDRAGHRIDEAMSSGVYLDGFDATEDNRRNLAWILLRNNLAACLDRF